MDLVSVTVSLSACFCSFSASSMCSHLDKREVYRVLVAVTM